jgi:SpoVK/Ycf46/Vps4 family AAA+-type ATPase
VQVLFDLARYHAPSTVFLDEIDALMGARGEAGEHEASRRMKTELLIQVGWVGGACACYTPQLHPLGDTPTQSTASADPHARPILYLHPSPAHCPTHLYTLGSGCAPHHTHPCVVPVVFQMDGLAKSSALVFVLCATNLPWELDMVGGRAAGGEGWRWMESEHQSSSLRQVHTWGFGGRES